MLIVDVKKKMFQIHMVGGGDLSNAASLKKYFDWFVGANDWGEQFNIPTLNTKLLFGLNV